MPKDYAKIRNREKYTEEIRGLQDERDRLFNCLCLAEYRSPTYEALERGISKLDKRIDMLIDLRGDNVPYEYADDLLWQLQAESDRRDETNYCRTAGSPF